MSTRASDSPKKKSTVAGFPLLGRVEASVIPKSSRLRRCATERRLGRAYGLTASGPWDAGRRRLRLRLQLEEAEDVGGDAGNSHRRFAQHLQRLSSKPVARPGMSGVCPGEGDAEGASAATALLLSTGLVLRLLV